MPSILTPLSALNIARDTSHTSSRKLTQLATAGGKFSVRAHALGPVGSHPVHLDLTTVEEIDDFWSFYDSILGACEPFWLPTFQRDFVPLAPIDAADLVFNIQDRQYKDFEFPDACRRKLAIVLSDGTILKREIVNAETNDDGTEQIEINEALGQVFTQRRANGICYLLYGRLSEDTIKMEWWSHDIAEVDFTFSELREDAPEGSTL